MPAPTSPRPNRFVGPGAGPQTLFPSPTGGEGNTSIRLRIRSFPRPRHACDGACVVRTLFVASQEFAGTRRAMNITVSGSVPTRRGPADSFTGTVWQDPIIDAPAPARIRGAFVRFEPRARTAWHTHPLGQTLHVISGVGRAALCGGLEREICAGGRVWLSPGREPC